MKTYYWMYLAYWLNLKIIIKIKGKKGIGCLGTPKNHLGNFYLYNKQSAELVLCGKTDEVEYASFFWGFIFYEKVKVVEPKKDYERLISDLPVSNCVPLDGNILQIKIPNPKISSIPISYRK